MTEQQEEALAQYRLLDDLRQRAKAGATFAQHPLDEECAAAWSACIAAFDSHTAAREALHGTAPRGAALREREVPQRAPKRGTRPSGARDPRIPAPGTTIYKRDRHGAVLAEALVVEDGISYDGVVYGSPSAAGLAASTALGLGTKSVNGFLFWNL